MRLMSEPPGHERVAVPPWATSWQTSSAALLVAMHPFPVLPSHTRFGSPVAVLHDAPPQQLPHVTLDVHPEVLPQVE